jgi:hypothetical protein
LSDFGLVLDREDHGASAMMLLGVIQSVIGPLEEQLSGRAGLWECGQAQRTRQFDDDVRLNKAGLQRFAYPSARRPRFLIVEGRVDYDAELISAEPGEEERVVAHRLHPPGRLDEDAVAGDEPNAIIGAIHSKAMPVFLTVPEKVEAWMSAPASEALKLQRPLSDVALRIVARGAKQDGPTP